MSDLVTRGLFELNDNGDVTFNSPLFLVYEPFDVIWRSDKTQKKEVAYSILKYIYYMYDYFYYTAELKPSDRKQKAIKLSKINVDLVDTKQVQQAGEFYVAMQEEFYPAIKLYRNLNVGVNLTSQAIEVLNGTMITLLEKANEFIKQEQLPSVDEIMKKVSNINSIAADFPKTLDTLKKLETELRNRKGDDVARGGGIVGDFENPDE